MGKDKELKPISDRVSVYNLVKEAKSSVEKGELLAAKDLFKKAASYYISLGKPSKARAVLVDAGDFFKKQNYWGVADDIYRTLKDNQRIANLWDSVAVKFGDVEIGGKKYTVTENDRESAYHLAGDAYKQLGEMSKAETRYARAGNKLRELEKRVAGFAAFFSFFLYFTFVTPSVTGDAISGINAPTANILGALFFFAGVLFLLVYFKPSRIKVGKN